jgi:hypothetical protein
MPNTTIKPQHWHNRAKEARTAAQIVRAPDIKRVLLTIAENFEELAKRAKEPRQHKAELEAVRGPDGKIPSG